VRGTAAAAARTEAGATRPVRSTASTDELDGCRGDAPGDVCSGGSGRGVCGGGGGVTGDPPDVASIHTRATANAHATHLAAVRRAVHEVGLGGLRPRSQRHRWLRARGGVAGGRDRPPRDEPVRGAEAAEHGAELAVAGRLGVKQWWWARSRGARGRLAGGGGAGRVFLTVADDAAEGSGESPSTSMNTGVREPT